MLGDKPLWVLLALALVFRVGYNLALHAGGHGPSTFVIDEREYFGAAHVLAEGRGFSFFDTALWVRPPLYVLFLALFTGTDTTTAMFAQSLLSTLTLLPLAAIGARLGGRRAARWTALLGAFYLPFTLFAGLLLSETLFVLLFACAFLALLRARDLLAMRARWGVLPWATAAGLLMGLSVLTRSTALAFVPLAALWLLISAPGVDSRSRLKAAGTIIGVCLLALVPWILRNAAAYHRFVLVDTTSGYNLWLGSVGVRDEPRLQADLLKIPNPADRQSFAYAQAWQNIRSDPGFFIRKGLKESLDLWRPLFSAEEHQVSGYALGRVPAWHLLSIVLLDDWLYLAILLLALVGFLIGREWSVSSLSLLWVGLWVAMSFVFFAVTRFRLPVVAILLPWAGLGVTLLPSVKSLLRPTDYHSRLALAGGAVVALAILVALVPGMVFTIQSSVLGAQRWSEQAPYRGAEAALSAGRVDEAISLYRQANTTLADTRYGLAAAYLEKGDSGSARGLLTSNEPADRFEPYLILGEAARRSGDLNSARSFFNERVVRLAGDDSLQWAWDHMNPSQVGRIDVGSGLDIGYIRGFYAPETGKDGITYRWSADRAEIRNVRAVSNTLSLVWNPWRPASSALPRVFVVDLGNREVTGPLAPGDAPAWTTTRLPVQPPEAVQRLRTTTFVPGGSDPRLLGIQVARVGSQP